MTEPYVRPEYWEFGYAEFDQLTMQATGSSTSASAAALSLLVVLSGTSNSFTASNAYLNINVVFTGTSTSISGNYAELLKSNIDYKQAIGLARNSIATTISGRALRKYAADKARFVETPSGSNLGLLLENPSTNIARYSEDLSNAVWVKGANLVEISMGSFLGFETRRYLVSETTPIVSNPELYQIYQQVPVSQNTQYSVSFFKKSSQPSVVRTVVGGVDHVTTGVLVSSEFYKHSVTFTTGAGETNVRVFVNDQALANNQVIEAIGLQVEQSSFVTSYIPTLNVDGTRVSDKYFVTEAAYSNLLRTLRTTVVLDVEETVNREAVILEARDRTIDLKIRVRKTTSDFICDVIDTGVVVATSSFPKPSGSRYMVVLTSGPRGIAFAVNSSARFITQGYRFTGLGNTLVGTDDLFVNKATDFNGLVKDIKFIHKEYSLVEITQMSSTSNFTIANTID